MGRELGKQLANSILEEFHSNSKEFNRHFMHLQNFIKKYIKVKQAFLNLFFC